MRLIEALQKENILSLTVIDEDGLRQQPKKHMKWNTKELQERLLNLCHGRRYNNKMMEEVLHGTTPVRFV